MSNHCLRDWFQGERASLELLTPIVSDELRHLEHTLHATEALSLDEALGLLANVDVQQRLIVDIRFFTGPTIASERAKPFREAWTEVAWGRRPCCFLGI